MQTANINGANLQFEIRGLGEPVVLVHGSILADGLAPLLKAPILTQHYRIIRYYRCSFDGSTRLTPPVSIAQQAEHCQALLRHLNIKRAHIVGYDYDGLIALQLALDAPEAVHSLALLEPPLMLGDGIPSGRQFIEEQFLTKRETSAQKMYEEGKKVEATDTFLQLVCGQRYREVIDQALSPNVFELAVKDADAFFQIEVPAGLEWSFPFEAAQRIKQPVLAVLGVDSRPLFREAHEMVLKWLPQVEEFVLPNGTHLLPMMNPQDLAAGLANFFIRHQMPLTASTLFDDEMDDLKNEVGTVLDDPDTWLNTPNDRFAGKKPIDLIGTKEEQRLHDLIRAIKHGMVA
jgi:pimeloyl-ACP methyl ester carboxylesterase